MSRVGTFQQWTGARRPSAEADHLLEVWIEELDARLLAARQIDRQARGTCIPPVLVQDLMTATEREMTARYAFMAKIEAERAALLGQDEN